MKISQFAKRYIGSDYSFRCVLNEIIEVFQAKSFDNFLEELNDVCFTFQVWLYIKTGYDWNMFFYKPSIDKMEDRLVWFKDHFKQLGLEFHPRYWQNGSNYKKPIKVSLAVKLALDSSRNII